MSNFKAHTLNWKKCKKQVSEFTKKLNKGKLVKEAKHILPFFRDRKDLTALFAELNSEVKECDVIAYELNLFGSYRPDIVVGNIKNGSFCFIELEEAKQNGVFGRRSISGKSDWGQKLEHGVGQIIDWMCELEDLKRTDKFSQIFGKNKIQIQIILVVGRNEKFSNRENDRLQWRKEAMSITGTKIRIYTYDELADYFNTRIGTIEKLLAAPKRKKK